MNNISLPVHQAVGIVDIDLGGEDCHNMFIRRMDEKALFVESTRTFESKKEYTFRFTLPVLDWVFEAKGQLEEFKRDEEKYFLLIHFLAMEEDDACKLQEFIEMHKTGKTEIKEIF